MDVVEMIERVIDTVIERGDDIERGIVCHQFSSFLDQQQLMDCLRSTGTYLGELYLLIRPEIAWDSGMDKTDRTETSTADPIMEDMVSASTDEHSTARHEFFNFSMITEFPHDPATSSRNLVPYGFSEGNPGSIFATVQALSNLIDMAATDNSDPLLLDAVEQVDASSDFISNLADPTPERYIHDIRDVGHYLLNSLVVLLLGAQDKQGWWSDDHDLFAVDNLPVWQHPDNASVRIFNTAAVLGVLARLFHSGLIDTIDTVSRNELDEAIRKGLGAIQTVTTDNGSLLGFPQATWLLTPVITYAYDPGDPENSSHKVALQKFIGTMDQLSNIIILARGLVNADIDHDDHLLRQCVDLISDAYNPGIGGWGHHGTSGLGSTGEYADRNSEQEKDEEVVTSISLAALIVLQYTQRTNPKS